MPERTSKTLGHQPAEWMRYYSRFSRTDTVVVDYEHDRFVLRHRWPSVSSFRQLHALRKVVDG